MIRVINNNEVASTGNGSTLSSMISIILVREVQNLAMHKELDSKGMLKLEKISNILKNLKHDEREDFKAYVQMNGLKGIDNNDPFVKKLYELMADSSGS